MAMERTSVFLLVGLIIAICFCIGFVYGIVKVNDELEKKQKELDAAKNKADSERRARLEAQTIQKAYARLIRGGEVVDVDSARAHLLQLKPTKFLQEQLKDILPKGLADKFDNLEEVIEVLLKTNIIISQRQEEWEQQVKAKEENLTRAKEDLLKAKDKWRQDIEALRAKIQSLESEKAQLVSQYEEQVRRLSEEKKQVQDEKDRLQKQTEIEMSRLRTKIGDLRARLARVIKKKPKDLRWADPDGEIYLADMNLSLCWIDLGRMHHVQTGMIFEVFRRGKGGMRVFKGRIEIRRVQDDLSQCAILECYDPENDPIVKGDFIISPLYDREETPILVFIGDFRNPYYSKRQLEKKLAEFNIKVESRVTVNTDWIVIGENPEAHEDYEKARFWNIPVMREEELLRYIGR